MKDGLRIALAVGAGYLMGRRRKMRLALTLAAAGASGRFGKNPAALVKRGTKLLNTSPEVKNLTETVRGRLVEAGKAAAVTAASSQIDALSDRLQRRTEALLRPRTPGGAREEKEDVYEGEGEGYEEEREERPRRGPAAVRRRPHGADDELADRPRTVRRGAPRGAESEDEPDEDLDRPRREARPSGQGPPPVRRTGR